MGRLLSSSIPVRLRFFSDLAGITHGPSPSLPGRCRKRQRTSQERTDAALIPSATSQNLPTWRWSSSTVSGAMPNNLVFQLQQIVSGAVVVFAERLQLHCSPASHASTRPSMFDKSATTSFFTGGAMMQYRTAELKIVPSRCR